MDSQFSGVYTAVYSYCIALAHERERLYEPTTFKFVEQTMQRKGSKHILFKRFECSSFKHFIQHTSTREMSELARLKTGNYTYFIAQANLHFLISN